MNDTEIPPELIIERMSADDIDLNWQLYQEECFRSHIRATISDFMIWLEERL